MTKAFNLALLGNFVDSNGKLNLSTGSINPAPSASSLQTTNFSIVESGGVLYIKYGATNIAAIDSSGNFVTLSDVTGYGSP
ncbi:hypothetical protein UFOVP405_48 [uncultured Caudovirales phage]|uniref:Uncharacterized protein n=1 Tax=uncultured Caudovirales phage TaxID=2100421 RepID=A0A6J5M0R4_9CAUD|nr:hypothetical protein UFOVP405_48 [uncultured Caudovirales phage]